MPFRSRLRTIELIAMALLAIPVSQDRASAASPAPAADLSGIWTASDGTMYYLHQVGSALWWAGLNPDAASAVPGQANAFHRGIVSTQVFRGTISDDTITGDWAEVPRQATPNLRNGTLQLLIRPGGLHLHVQVQTGGLNLTDLSRATIFGRPCADAAGRRDPMCLFSKVLKNQKEAIVGSHESLLDNLKPYKDNGVMFGTVAQGFKLGSPFDRSSTCADFFRNTDDDGDLTIDVFADRADLDSQPGFWTDGWINPPGNIQAKLKFLNNRVHNESIMFGRGNADCKQSDTVWLPGWAETGTNSMLFQGIPIAGNVLRSGDVVAIGGYGFPVGPGNRVRITGPIVLDCGHGIGSPCYETENDPNNKNSKNLEIHPIYAFDVLQDFTLPRTPADLTGTWAATDVGTYYVRQIGNTVWWLGVSRDQGLAFTNVFNGVIQPGNGPATIKGQWASVPLGQAQNSGNLTLSGMFCPSLTSPQPPCNPSGPVAQWDRLQTQQTTNPVFGNPPARTFQWQKLYDRTRVQVPQLIVPQTVSLGIIHNGDTGRGTLLLSNLGTAPVQIQGINTSLADVKVSPKTFTIGPGTSASVNVTWFVRNVTKPGKIIQTATLRVLSNDPTAPSTAVTVQMAVWGGVPQ